MRQTQADASPHARTKARRVLVVDDNRDAADALSALLRFMGYVVKTAYDGAEGLSVAEAFDPDVAIWDLSMPGIDGFESARRLREQARGHSVLLIALSGHASSEDSSAARSAGFDVHMAKPMDVAALLDTVGCA